MISRIRVQRLLGIFAMALQLLLPPSLTIADALIDRGGPTSSHVEDQTGKGCRPTHAADCAVCRTISGLTATRAATPCIEMPLGVAVAPPAEAAGTRLAQPWFIRPPSRAPPAA